jgi:HAD superfamily hydrolase (TIGR01509 family)
MEGVMGVLRGILFDLDGTLVDSEPNYQASDKLFLASLGHSLPEERWPSYMGRGAKSFVEEMRAEFSLQQSVDELIALKDQSYQRLAATETRAFPATVELNRLARIAGLKTAIASGSSLAVIENSLEWSGIGRPFDLLLSASAVPRGKPEPDVFLAAAARLGLEPGECLVVEDSLPGVQAGLAAGMRVLALPYDLAHLDHEVFRQAHYLCPGSAALFDCVAFVDALKAEGLWLR